MKPTRLFILILLAMIAFAGNSLLCRVALRQTTRIDAASFTFVRIVSGAVALLVITKVRSWFTVRTSLGSPLVTPSSPLHDGNWLSGFALFAYAAAFSFAYINLTAGTGALLLFGSVQATMIVWGWSRGERLRLPQLLGLALALGGLVALSFPGLSAPPLGGAVLMLGAGVAWGLYSLRGKTAKNPVSATTGNFLRAAPFAAVLIVLFLPWAKLDRTGAGYAVLSGAIASGLGYVIWYTALPGLKAANAATVQLSVPVLAATGGILLLGEPLTLRFLMASIAVLGGIAFVVVSPRRL